MSEAATRTATNSPTLRDVAPTHGETYALPTSTEWALQDLFFDVGEWLTTEAGDEFSSLEATAIVSGNGSSRPTGLLNSAPTASDDDASPMRAQDVLEYIPSGGASTITSDGLIDLAVGSIKERYLLDTTAIAWVMHRSTLATVRKLKASGTGEYLFSPGMTAGVAGTLLGYPVLTCDAMPAVTTNSYSIIFGNWKRGYVLVDIGGSVRITVDPYSTPGKIRFYVRRRVGGRILNNDALKVLKTATA